MPCPPQIGPVCQTATFIKDLATKANLDDVKSQLAAVKAELDTLATRSDIAAVQTQVAGTQSLVAVVDGKLDVIQAALGAGLDKGELDVQVLEEHRPDKLRGWLLKTTHEGKLVTPELTSVLVVKRPKKDDPAVVEDATHLATAVPILPGLLEVTIQPVPALNKMIAFQFEVQYQVDATTVVQGSALVANDPENK
jgi:hypothetical protein